MRGGQRLAWFTTFKARGLITLIAILGLTVLWPASAAWAQLAAPNEAGVAMGHVHYNVHDVEASKKFWMALGGAPIRFGTTDVVKFPELLIFLSQAQSSGGAEGSAFSHLAFKSRNLAELVKDLTTAGQKLDRNNAVTPDGVHIELFQEMTDPVKFVPDPGHDNPVSQRHARPMPGAIGTHHIHIYLPEGDDEKGRRA